MFEFLRQYLRHPFTVGAIAPSGKELARKMMEPVDFSRAECIVEYGPGTGAFTRELCRRKRPGTRLILIEQNADFCNRIRDRFGNVPNVEILHGSAENADRYLAARGIPQADYVVSGLPFTSLPRAVSLKIFDATRRIIGGEGKFITFQYTLVKEKFFKAHFTLERKIRAKRNLPPAYVFVCSRPRKGA